MKKLLAGAALVAALALTGCGGSHLPFGPGLAPASTPTATPTPPPAPMLPDPTSVTTFTVTGTLTLPTSGASGTGVVGTVCEGSGGYDDIQGGAQVVVSDPAGATIAIGQLIDGMVTDQGCTFSFYVPDVPSSYQFYGVQVSHRGVLQYPKDRITQALALSLGTDS